MKSLALALALFFSITHPLLALESSDANTIYDSNPNHLWNRLNQALFQRTAPDGKKFGLDELDILYWSTTSHLLTEPSHQQARTVLDEFIDSHGEKLISDPLKHAMLQRDLWELFDWLVRQDWPGDPKSVSREFEPKLVTVIRRLALDTNQIASLPDNYVQADARRIAELPHDLFNTNGEWVSVANGLYGTIAPVHEASFDGHSGFSVMLHMPGGRQAALDYLGKLRSFAQLDHTWAYESNRLSWRSTNEPKEILELNPQIPQFPTNTQWALVRTMCVIDTEGRIRPTPITESIQLRRYLQIKPVYYGEQDAQQFFEFEMDKRHYAALRAIGSDEKDFNFVHFQSQGHDLFGEELLDPGWARSYREVDSTKLQRAVLSTCFTCHNSSGIFSVLSYTGFNALLAPSPVRQPADMTAVPYKRQTDNAIGWKSGQYNWGLFQGLWRQVD